MNNSLSLQAAGILAVAAAITQLLGYCIYIFLLRGRKVEADGASWATITLGLALNTLSFHSAVKDWNLEALMLTNFLGALITTLVCTSKKSIRFAKADYVAIGTNVILALLWLIWPENETLARYRVVGLVVSLAIKVGRNSEGPKGENPVIWILWSVAHLMLAFALLYRSSGWNEMMVYPVVATVFYTLVTAAVCEGTLKGWLMENKQTLAEVGTGLFLYEGVWNQLFDLVFYPWCILTFGLTKGGLIAAAASFAHVIPLFWFYNWMRVDWLAATVVRSMADDENKGQLAKIAAVIHGKKTGWRKWILTPIQFIGLTAVIDPLIVAVHYREEHFSKKISGRDWGVLLASLVSANGLWCIKISVIMIPIRFVLQHFGLLH